METNLFEDIVLLCLHQTHGVNVLHKLQAMYCIKVKMKCMQISCYMR